jgi:hypothetical protein
VPTATVAAEATGASARDAVEGATEAEAEAVEVGMVELAVFAPAELTGFPELIETEVAAGAAVVAVPSIGTSLGCWFVSRTTFPVSRSSSYLKPAGGAGKSLASIVMIQSKNTEKKQ